MTNIPSWAVVGAKVVCVNSIADKGPWVPMEPINKGEILTIRGVRTTSMGVGLYFLEKRHPVVETTHGEMERSYLLHNFKPLVAKTLEEDMEMFVPLLKTVREEEFV